MNHGSEYLTDDEFDALAPVCTTREEADQIIERCTALLELVREHRAGSVAIGCPHCRGGYPCGSCAYPEITDKSQCCNCAGYYFGGVCLDDQDFLTLSDHGAAWSEPDPYDRPISEVDRARVIAFLEAHIEWAQNLKPAECSWRAMDTVAQDAWLKQRGLEDYCRVEAKA